MRNDGSEYMVRAHLSRTGCKLAANAPRQLELIPQFVVDRHFPFEQARLLVRQKTVQIGLDQDTGLLAVAHPSWTGGRFLFWALRSRRVPRSLIATSGGRRRSTSPSP